MKKAKIELLGRINEINVLLKQIASLRAACFSEMDGLRDEIRELYRSESLLLRELKELKKV